MRAKESFTDDLAETKTDDKGEATFDLRLNRFTNATYRLHFLAEGFEARRVESVDAFFGLLQTEVDPEEERQVVGPHLDCLFGERPRRVD